MQVLLCEPDIVGYTMSLDPTVYNLCRGLKAFFKENRAGVMLSRLVKYTVPNVLLLLPRYLPIS